MKIRCTIPNASEEINGLKFAPHEGGGVVSVDDVPDDVAKALLTIDGYEAVEGDKAPAAHKAKKAAATQPVEPVAPEVVTAAGDTASEGQGASGSVG